MKDKVFKCILNGSQTKVMKRVVQCERVQVVREL